MLANIALDTNPRRKQTFSKTLVEQKRLGRTLPAVINGLSASQAQSQGMVSDFSAAETSSVSDHEPLFMENSDEEQKSERPQSTAPEQKDETKTKLDPNASPFNPIPAPFQFPTPSEASFASNGTFGKPTPLNISGLPPGSSSIFKPGASDTEKPNLFGTQQTPKFGFPTVLDTSKQSSNDTVSSSPANETAPRQDVFKQPPSLPSKAPGFSFGTSAIFGKNERRADLSSSSQDITDAASKESSRRPANSMFPELKTQALPSTTPTSMIFNSPAPNPTFFPALFTTPTPTPSLFPSPKTSSALNEPPSTEALSPFSTFPPTAGKPMFPLQSDSNKSAPLSFAPASSKAGPFETSPTTTTQSQPFLFPPSTASGPSFTANSHATPVSPMDISQTHVQAGLSAAPSAFSSNVSRLSFTPMLSPAEQAKARPPRPDPRPAALDKLSEAMMMDDEGLLSQFIEYAIGPVIAASFHQIKDERSWAKASMWLWTDQALRALKLTSNRGSPCGPTKQEIFQKVANQYLEKGSASEGKGAKEELRAVDARISTQHTKPTIRSELSISAHCHRSRQPG